MNTLNPETGFDAVSAARAAARSLPSPLDIPAALWEKYATRAPRYTSYPTAPCFTENFDRETALGQYRECAGRTDISLYLHIPFCQRRCLYCGCHLFIKQERDGGGLYVEKLLKESRIIAGLIGTDHRVMQLALGGGTPNFLLPEDMNALLDGIRGLWNFPDEGERSIELDTRTVDPDYIDLLLDQGFTRFSLGVQDLDTAVIDRLRKNQSRDYVERISTHIRARGINAVNFDLMYGLPGQTRESFGKTIDDVIAMRPSRVALFGYAHVPWMKPHQKALERFGLPQEVERIVLWGTAFGKFRDAGYIPIGMDHFAEPDDELTLSQQKGLLTRNFMGYTMARGLDLVGLGASSISAVGGVYVQNEKDLAPYESAIDEGRAPWHKGLSLTGDDRIRRELIIDLFSNFALDIAAFERKFDIDFGQTFADERRALDAFISDGLLEISDAFIRVTPIGRFFIRNICTTFDRYLDSTGARYSKTV
jgi:oxygen-independent coproporphyrinogen III oxidase